jgi:Ca-activated chloride channel family protein
LKNASLCLCVLMPLCLALCFAAGAQTLKVDVNLVSIFATIKDAQGNFVTNLSKDDFRVYDDDQPQDIQVFEKQDKVESSIGMLVDTSGSMVDIIPYMKRGVREFAHTMPKADDFFLVSFGTTVRLVHTSKQPARHLEESLGGLRAFGTSSLFDGLLYSMEKVERSDRPRKALIVFTDGNDNGSNVSHGRIVQEVQESAVLLYFVAIGSPVLVDSHTLESLSDISGGRTFYVPKQDAIAPVLDQVRTELAQQYYLGYYVPKRAGFHRIRVEVPNRDLRIRAKTGYTG